MTKCITYKRFSTVAQEGNSSIMRQTEAIDAFLKDESRKDWVVVEQIEDLGRSAWSGDHLRAGKLGKLKARIDSGEIEPGTVLIVENIDRLSRQEIKKARRWVEEVTEAGILLAVCRPTPKVFNEASLSGENIIELLMYLLEAQRSHAESLTKSDRNKGAWRKAEKAAAETGKVISKQVPAWLRVTPDRKIEVNEERAEVVRRIYELSSEGRGFATIAKKLTEEGIQKWGAQATTDEWEWSYVRKILASPAVEGEYHPGRRTGASFGSVIPDYYPRVVPPELVARARAAINGRARTGGHNYANPANLFAGIARCVQCGSTMLRTHSTTTSAGYKASYLQCYKARKGGDCSHRTQYRYETFEREALDIILDNALDDRFFTKADETVALSNKVALTKKALEFKKAEQKRLVDILKRIDDAPEIEEELAALRPEARQLEEEVAQLERALASARGRVSPEEHIARVMRVRHAVDSEDQTARSEARLLVKEAIANVVSVVQCNPAFDYHGVTHKALTVIFNGGEAGFTLSSDGEYLDGWSFSGELRQRGVTASALREAFRANGSERTAANGEAFTNRNIGIERVS